MPTFPREHDAALSSPSRVSAVRWLVVLRIVVVTTLFLTALLLQFLAEVPFPLLRPLFHIIVLVYGLSLAFLTIATLKPDWMVRDAFVYAQLAGDVAAATWLVYLTGGVESSFSFLYHIPIIVGSVLLYRRGALILAAMSAIAYGGLVDLIYYGVIPPYRQAHFVHSFSYLYYYLIVNLTGFFIVALLSGYLTERSRRRDMELERTAEELDRLQAFHRNVLESMDSGLLAVNLRGEVEFANSTALRWLGTTTHALRGKPLHDVLPALPKDLGKFASERGGRGEIAMPLPAEGPERIVQFHVSVLHGKEGEQSGWILLLEDITEVKAMEEALRVKDRMAALGEMSAGLAHEIRNPLASIRGSAQMLERNLRLEGEDRQLLRLLDKETERLNRTIEAFLDYARGGRRKAYQPAPMAPLLEETLAFLRNSDQRLDSHDIAVEAAEAADIVCEVDPDQMRQVFWNLALNALQAMPAGGKLTVSLRRRDMLAEIAFSDTGRGIPAQDMASVVLPFKSGSPKGLGLGLSIAYRIVEQHHGNLSIESRVGHGTRVTVHLPLAASPAATEPKRSSTGGV